MTTKEQIIKDNKSDIDRLYDLAYQRGQIDMRKEKHEFKVEFDSSEELQTALTDVLKKGYNVTYINDFRC